LSVLRLAVVSLFGATLALGLLLPIWTDEVTWKAVTARTWVDGLTNIYVFPQCTSSFAVAPPWFMWPARLMGHWLYADFSHPDRLRVAGAFVLAGWIGLLLVALPRCAAAGVRLLPLTSWGAALLGLGVLPFILILNRPEQLLRLIITLFLVAPFVVKRGEGGWLRSLVASFSVILLASVLCAEHPKSLYYLPVVLVSTLYLVEGRALRAATVVTLGLMAWGAARHWYARMVCPEDAWLQAFFDRETVRPAALLSGFIGGGRPLAPTGEGSLPLGLSPRSGPEAVLENLTRCVRYVSQTLFQRHHEGDWLIPRSRLLRVAPFVNAAITAVWICVTLVALWMLVRLALEVARTRRLSRQAAIAGALFVPLVASCVLEARKAFYESSLILPFLGVLLLLCLRPPVREPWVTLGRYANVAVLVVALTSLATLWATVLPHLGGWLSRGYVPGQRSSVSAFGAEDQRGRVLAAAGLCGIDVVGTTDHLLVDELTSTVFTEARQPLFTLYFSRYWYKGPDLATMLKAWGSAGMVASCEHVPESLRPRARRFGDLCCLPSFGDSAPASIRR
jgi:hypothetical protein